MALSDSVTARQAMRGSMSEDLAPSDGIVGKMPMRGSISDAISATDLLSGLMAFKGTVSDDIGIADAISALMRLRGSISELYDITEGDFTLTGTYYTTISETLAMVDEVVHSLLIVGGAIPLEYGFTESLSMSDAITGLMRLRGLITDAANISDEAGVLFVHRGSMGDTLSLTDLVLHQLIEVGVAYPLSYPFGDTLSMSDSVLALQRHFGSMSDAIAAGDAMAFVAPFLGSMGDSFGQSDGVAGISRHLAGISESTWVTDGASGLFVYRAQISEAINWDDLVTSFLWASGAIYLTISEDYAAQITDAVLSKGWGITATYSGIPAALQSPDERAITLVGPDTRTLIIRRIQ